MKNNTKKILMVLINMSETASKTFHLNKLHSDTDTYNWIGLGTDVISLQRWHHNCLSFSMITGITRVTILDMVDYTTFRVFYFFLHAYSPISKPLTSRGTRDVV